MTLEERIANLEAVVGLHVTGPNLKLAIEGIVNALDDLEDRVMRLEGGDEAPTTDDLP